LNIKRATVVCESLGTVRWEIATRAPAIGLRPFVRDYCGYSEWTERPAPGVARRREFPAPQIVVIFEFGPPIAVSNNRDGHRLSRYSGGFVAGLDDRFSFTEHDGIQHGLQLNLTPLGARLFFDLPMSEIAGRVVHFNDVMPREHRFVAEQLAALDTWDERFDTLERLLTTRISRTTTRARSLPSPASDCVAWAYAQILRHEGNIDIRKLAAEIGYSHPHLITLFRNQIGFPPKLVARIVRFDHLMKRLKTRRTDETWATLAADLGYYDQAHLVHDIRQFTGLTPNQTHALLLDTPIATTLDKLLADQQDEPSHQLA
jgi:AraC-like DNA-binding protein